jgi:hypothetical protein
MPMTRPTECVESLRVNFTDDEKRQRGLSLAEAFNALGELDDEESVIKAQMKEKRAGAEAKVSILARELAAGFTVQMVKCRLSYDDPNPNEVSYYRIDNDELVRTRPFSREERQADLPLADGTIAVVAVPAEESQQNIAEFFDEPGEPQPTEYRNETADAVDERSDDEPEVIEDADPLGINEAPSLPEPLKAPDPKAVARAARKLQQM